MKKKNVQLQEEERVNKIISDLRLNSVNNELFDKQIEKLKNLLTKVEPTEIHVPLSDVEKEYQFGAFSIVRTKKEIIYKSNGYRVVVKPWINRLYTVLSFICDCKDKGDKIEEQDKQMYEMLLPIAVSFLSLPINGFSEDQFTANIYKCIIKGLNDMYDRLLNKPLQEDDEVANNEFKERIEVIESIKNELKND